MIPVSVITGFLGSGKTTILSHLLRQPEFADTAVIINEFGEIGLDHDLIETSDETVVTLQTGCLCCKLQDDLVLTLHDLLKRRDAGTVPRFTRVVVETSGLADPAPVLQSLMMDDVAAEYFPLARVLTVVDALTGAATLANHAEARHQLAVADRIVVSKIDLSGGVPPELRQAIRTINPAHDLAWSDSGRIPADLLFAGQGPGPCVTLDLLETLLASETQDGHHHHAHGPATGAIRTFTLLRDAPLSAVSLSLFLEALADHCGADLLRLKGLVHIEENPARPAVVHGVQHVFHPPVWLDAWPSADHRTRLVFIARDVEESWVKALLYAIEAEVRDMAHHPASTRKAPQQS
jgi:G3E family GTPase